MKKTTINLKQPKMYQIADKVYCALSWVNICPECGKKVIADTIHSIQGVQLDASLRIGRCTCGVKIIRSFTVK